MRRRRTAATASAGLVLLLFAGPASAQAGEETRLLREAAARESRGDLAGAEQALLRLLEGHPGSSGGIFALERVLRARGAPRELLGPVDAFLARDPAAAGVRHLKIRLLVELDSLGAVPGEAEAWFRAQPASERAYRDVAALYERAFGPGRALEVLERGRGAVGRPGSLALEMGDLLVHVGRIPEALREWALAVGDDGAQASTVARRLAGLPDDPTGASRAVVGILAKAPGAGRRQAGLRIAIEGGLEDEALPLARTLADGMGEGARGAFLADLARRAREAGLGELAGWAYARLGEGAGSAAERRQFDQRLVELSLGAGDTLAALTAQRRVVASLEPGTGDRRRARALEVRLEAGAGRGEGLAAALAGFREEFPGATELDALAAHAALRLHAAGDLDAAAAALEGVEGSRSSVERGYLLLAAGSVDEARRAFLQALPGLDPEEATGLIQFASLLARLGPPGRDALARAGTLAHLGRGVEGAALLEGALGSVDAAGGAALLAEAARMADAGGGPEEGARLRDLLLAVFPGSPEWPEAALALARFRAQAPGGEEAAVRLLEEILAQAPGAAVAPDARREMERLRRGP